MLPIKEYLDMIRPYLSDIANNHTTQGKWKIQLKMTINFFSSKDSEETYAMHTKSDNIGIMMGSETDETIEELFESFLRRYQGGLEESMKGSEFVFYSVDLLCHELHKISVNRSGSYIDSPKWLKNKESTINPKNNDDKCFEYALTIALNHQNINNNNKKKKSRLNIKH